MTQTRIVAMLAVLATAGAASALTPVQDGVLGEWWGDPTVIDLGSEPAPDGGGYNLLVSSDLTDLHIGMARDSSDRYLGETNWDNDSFFLAIDTDGTPGSGAPNGAYGRLDFGGTMRPDRMYAYAGGAGWYEICVWDGANWTYPGWSDAGTFYGHDDTYPDDELSVPLADIGGSANVMIWAWMTREENAWIEASWPSGSTGDHPTMGDGIIVPEPMTMVLLLAGGVGLLLRRRRG